MIWVLFNGPLSEHQLCEALHDLLVLSLLNLSTTLPYKYHHPHAADEKNQGKSRLRNLSGQANGEEIWDTGLDVCGSNIYSLSIMPCCFSFILRDNSHSR